MYVVYTLPRGKYGRFCFYTVLYDTTVKILVQPSVRKSHIRDIVQQLYDERCCCSENREINEGKRRATCQAHYPLLGQPAAGSR